MQRSKAAVKLHTLLDLRGNILAFIHITDARWQDSWVLDELIPGQLKQSIKGVRAL